MGRTELVLLIGGKARYVEPFEDAVFGSVARTLAARVPEQESDARRRTSQKAFAHLCDGDSALTVGPQPEPQCACCGETRRLRGTLLPGETEVDLESVSHREFDEKSADAKDLAIVAAINRALANTPDLKV
jgi:hypothetical protein